MKSQNAIVMIAIGDRPWAKYSSATFKIYAQRINADFHVVESFPGPEEFPFPELADEPGRKFKRAYASKTFFAWKYMAKLGYKRVLIVDDTCCIRTNAPDVFSMVPPGKCGFTTTSPRHAEKSFKAIRAFIRSHHLDKIAFDPKEYMNTGVMLYDDVAVKAISPVAICEAADLMFAPYPNQSLTYYLLHRAKVPLFVIPKTFNAIPGVKLKKSVRQNITDIRDFMDERIQIFHITSAYKDNRELFVKQICEVLLKEPV